MYQFFATDLKTALILSILARATAEYPTACPSGEIFTECSSYCEPSCIPQDIACIQSCGPPACQCMPGLVRDNGVCVDPRLCSNVRPTTPSYVDEPVTPPLTSCDQALVQILCIAGYHCEIVNGTPQCVPDTGNTGPVPTQTPPSVTCASTLCTEGTYCVENDGRPQCLKTPERIPRCVDVRVKCAAGHHCEDTPTGITCAPDPVCPANEEFNICASDCEQTCFQMGRPCTTQCLPAKCQCKSGFVREGGRCIDSNTCPNRQPVSTTTLGYVDEPVTPPLTSCDQAKFIRILCVTGYHCEIVNGAPQCVPDTGNTRPVPTQTPPSVTCASTLCTEGTYCEENDGRPKCVKIPACGANEEFRQCASCEPTCGPIVPCIDICFPPACQCTGGYVRDNGKCIRRTDCTDDYIRGKI